MMTRQKYKNDCIILKTIEEIVPEKHLVRKLDEAIDLKFIEDEIESLYSLFGKPSVPPMGAKNTNQALLIFACHNLKKMALWRWEKVKNKKKSSKNIININDYLSKMKKITNNYIEKVIGLFKLITLSTT